MQLMLDCWFSLGLDHIYLILDAYVEWDRAFAIWKEDLRDIEEPKRSPLIMSAQLSLSCEVGIPKSAPCYRAMSRWDGITSVDVARLGEVKLCGWYMWRCIRLARRDLVDFTRSSSNI